MGFLGFTGFPGGKYSPAVTGRYEPFVMTPRNARNAANDELSIEAQQEMRRKLMPAFPINRDEAEGTEND